LCFPCTSVRACYAIESINHSKIDTKRKAKNPVKAHGWTHMTLKTKGKANKERPKKMRRLQGPKKRDTS
jgi:hypothetical protein